MELVDERGRSFPVVVLLHNPPRPHRLLLETLIWAGTVGTRCALGARHRPEIGGATAAGERLDYDEAQ